MRRPRERAQIGPVNCIPSIFKSLVFIVPNLATKVITYVGYHKGALSNP